MTWLLRPWRSGAWAHQPRPRPPLSCGTAQAECSRKHDGLRLKGARPCWSKERFPRLDLAVISAVSPPTARFGPGVPGGRHPNRPRRSADYYDFFPRATGSGGHHKRRRKGSPADDHVHALRPPSCLQGPPSPSPSRRARRQARGHSPSGTFITMFCGILDPAEHSPASAATAPPWLEAAPIRWSVTGIPWELRGGKIRSPRDSGDLAPATCSCSTPTA
jgi:hypothetical protein